MDDESACLMQHEVFICAIICMQCDYISLLPKKRVSKLTSGTKKDLKCVVVVIVVVMVVVVRRLSSVVRRLSLLSSHVPLHV